MYKETKKIPVMGAKKEVPINKLKKRQSGTVKKINTMNTVTVQKLLAMGIVPGRIIHIIRTYAVYILQIDNTEVAMDKELAQNVILMINSL
ncbi:MAG: FeoA family protein [Bacteroidales bacterium]